MRHDNRVRPVLTLVLAVCVAAPLLAVPAARSVTAPEPPVPEHAPSEAGTGFGWPLRPRPRVVRPFERPECRYCPGHRGVDLEGGHGQPVRAARDGTVVYADRLAGRGVVSVDHGQLRTTYEPVTPRVAEGDRVRAGQRIATVVAGHPGCVVPSCLHWGLRRGEEYLDPLAALGVGPLRLKPVPPAATPGAPDGPGPRTRPRPWSRTVRPRATTAAERGALLSRGPA